MLKSKRIFILLAFLITSCSNPTPLNNIKENKPAVSFNTEALSQSYLKRKVKYFIDQENGGKIVKEIAYARENHPDLLIAVILDDPDLYDQILSFSEVGERMGIDPLFKEYILSMKPVPLVPNIVHETRVNTYTQGAQYEPFVAVSANGAFVITWNAYDYDGGGTAVLAQRYNSTGVAQGSEFLVNTYVTSYQDLTNAAMDDNGNFIISWTSDGEDGSESGVYAQRYGSTGSPAGTEFRVNSYTLGTQFLSSVACDHNGNFVITWTSRDQVNFDDVFAQLYNSNGNPIGSEFIVNTTTTLIQQYSKVAMDSAGNFVIVWHSIDVNGGKNKIQGRRFDSTGQPLGSDFLISTASGLNNSYPSIAMNSSGNFVVSWQSDNNRDGSQTGIYARMYDNNGVAQGPDFPVNTYTNNAQERSSVAMDSSGNFTITWHSWLNDTDEWGIAARSFDSSGNPVNPEFIVNTTTLSSQTSPSVGKSANGNFVIAWQNDFPNGDPSFIFAKRYDSNGVEQ